MITINWEKRYTEKRGLNNPYYSDGEAIIGLISFKSDKQDLSYLDVLNKESIVGKIDNVKFPLSFTITPKDGMFDLISISPISLKTYEELSYRIEKWGEFDSIKDAMDKSMLIVQNFKTNFLTGNDN